MKCSYCNHQLPDDSEFCQYCGNKLDKESNTTETTNEAPKHIEETIYVSSVAKSSNIQPQPHVKKEKKIKVKYCSRCGALIDFKTKTCTGCGKKYFKIRINKFSVVITIMSIVIVALSTLNIYQFTTSNNTNKELIQQLSSLEKQIGNKDSSIKYLKSLIDDSNEKYLEYLQELNFFRNSAVIVGDDGTKKYHKYNCSKLDTTDGYWIFNEEYAEYKGYKKCSECN